MIIWEPMKPNELHKGAFGYVKFACLTNKTEMMILCEVFDTKTAYYADCDKHRVEVVPVAGDRTCLWIDVGDIYRQLPS